MSSSAQGLRELTNEISSLLSEGGIRLAPLQNGRDSPPSLGYHSYNIPTLVPPSDAKHTTSTPLLTSGVSLSQHSSLPSTTSVPSVIVDTTRSQENPYVPYLTNEQGQGQSPLTNEQGRGQSPLIARPLFSVNGDSSQLSSRSQSRSSLLQLPGDTANDDTGVQIKAHAQTIDILVDEKATLQGKICLLTKQLSTKSSECSNFQLQLRESRGKIEEMRREHTVLTEDLLRSSKSLTQSRIDTSEARDSLVKMRELLEDQQQENTELVARVTTQSTELVALRDAATEMRGKLNMSELLQQQLSGGSPHGATPSQPDLSSRLAELEGETDRLHGDVRQLTLERDQAYSDLGALRESLVEQHETQVKTMAEVKVRLVEKEVAMETMKEQLVALQDVNESIKNQVATEHAQSVDSSRVAMEMVQGEKEELQSQVESLSQINTELTRLSHEQDGRITELEVQLSRVREESVDQQTLLTTIAQDREAVSRAMSQNKELKAQMVELQDAFVRLSQQNMDLASDLETERLRVAHLRTHPLIESEGKPLMPEGDAPANTSPHEGEDDEVLLLEKTGLQNQLVQLQTEHTNLSDQFNRLQTDYSAQSNQLIELQASHAHLSEQHETTLQQLVTKEEKEGTDFPESEATDVHNMSADELSLLQHNFNALQGKFVRLVTEKADLLEKLQENEHLIVELSYETETIGDYITLYQAQRDSLKSKFREKDLCIEQLTQEKVSMQAKLQDLQGLVRHVLSDRSALPASIPTPSVLPTPHTTSTPSRPHTHSTLPLHLRPQQSSGEYEATQLNDTTSDNLETFDKSCRTMEASHVIEDVSHMTFGDSQVTIDGDSLVSTATTEQILHLLDELDLNRERSLYVPCRICVGPIINV